MDDKEYKITSEKLFVNAEYRIINYVISKLPE